MESVKHKIVTILEVGFGNLPSISRVIKQLNIDTKIAESAEDILEAEYLIIPGVGSFAPDANYNIDKFIYNSNEDTYTCPQQHTLTTNGSWYQKSKQRYIYFVKHYKTSACSDCPALARCTKNKKGRLLERSEYQPYIDQNRENIEANSSIYKKRQSIVEHPYGTIKRQWGFYYITTKKGINRASADVGLMFVAYNLRRLMNIIGKDLLKKFLAELVLFFLPPRPLLKTFSAINKLCIFSGKSIILFYKAA
jgi:hypothetical protein